MYIPVAKVEVKINAKGIHVPNRLANISKLLLMKIATTTKSIAITKLTNRVAVCNGVVELNLLK
jgi:hypothetical protein